MIQQILKCIVFIFFITSTYGEVGVALPSNTNELYPKNNDKNYNEEKQESSYELSDFLFDERFVYPKAYDKKAWPETLTSGGVF